MKFTETPIVGAYLIEPALKSDERGYFARTWCHTEFEAHGLNTALAQCSTSFNHRSGTLRGLHFQAPPHMEAKLVRCTRGAIFDVIVDLRKGSASYGNWSGFTLTADNGHMLYLPEGTAHGFQTLVDETELFYQISTYYALESVRGLRWDDPDIAIEWPEAPERIISDRDRALPFLRDGDPHVPAFAA